MVNTIGTQMTDIKYSHVYGIQSVRTVKNFLTISREVKNFSL